MKETSFAVIRIGIMIHPRSDVQKRLNQARETKTFKLAWLAMHEMFGTPDKASSGPVRISTISSIIDANERQQRDQDQVHCVGCMGWQILARMTLMRIVSLVACNPRSFVLGDWSYFERKREEKAGGSCAPISNAG